MFICACKLGGAIILPVVAFLADWLEKLRLTVAVAAAACRSAASLGFLENVILHVLAAPRGHIFGREQR
jgi:hypothetical protein